MHRITIKFGNQLWKARTGTNTGQVPLFYSVLSFFFFPLFHSSKQPYGQNSFRLLVFYHFLIITRHISISIIFLNKFHTVIHSTYVSLIDKISETTDQIFSIKDPVLIHFQETMLQKSIPREQAGHIRPSKEFCSWQEEKQCLCQHFTMTIFEKISRNASKRS